MRPINFSDLKNVFFTRKRENANNSDAIHVKHLNTNMIVDNLEYLYDRVRKSKTSFTYSDLVDALSKVTMVKDDIFEVEIVNASPNNGIDAFGENNWSCIFYSANKVGHVLQLSDVLSTSGNDKAIKIKRKKAGFHVNAEGYMLYLFGSNKHLFLYLSKNQLPSTVNGELIIDKSNLETYRKLTLNSVQNINMISNGVIYTIVEYNGQKHYFINSARHVVLGYCNQIPVLQQVL